MSDDVNNLLELPTLWYHGTHNFRTQGIDEKGIDLSKSRRYLDFGPGFYLTTNYEQAEKQAFRVTRDYNMEQNKKFIDNGELAELTFGTVMVYELDNLLLAHSTVGHIFEETDEDWAKFILGNRSPKAEEFGYPFHNIDRKYEYVYGPLADGFRIPKLIKDLEKGRINKDTFLNKISEVYQFPYNNQLSLHTENAIECLTFKEVQVIDTRKPLNTGR